MLRGGTTDTVSGDHLELGAVLKEDGARALHGVDAHAHVCDDRCRRRVHLELLCHELHHCCEGSVFRYRNTI